MRPITEAAAGRAGRGAIALVGAMLLAASCGSDDTRHDAAPGGTSSSTGATTTEPEMTTTEPTAPGRPYEVLVGTKTLVDPSRPTDDPMDVLDAPARTLVTAIYTPDGDGPFPLVVLAHGKDGNPDRLSGLATGWAEAGYVVAVPAFPLTNDTIDGGARIPDYVNQPGDVSFVIDEMLRLSDEDGNEISGKVDAGRIGVAGHSLGAGTVYGVVFNSCCRDPRVGAVVLMAALRFPFDGEFSLTGTPALWIHGDSDESLPHDDSAEAYSLATPPKFLVTLVGGIHSPPFEDDADPHDAVVSSVTLDFWDAYLGDDSEAPGRLTRDGDVPGLATVDAEP